MIDIAQASGNEVGSGRGARGTRRARDAAHVTAAGASAPVPRYTEFASPLPRTDENGVVQDGFEKRLLRWELQHSARQLLGTKHRIGVCHRVPSTFVAEGQTPGVKVYRREDLATYYRGLMICASVWACPVCSAKIAERRRAELDQALTVHQANGGGVYHMLLTLPHTRRDEPKPLVELLLDTFRRLCSGKYRLGVLVPGFTGFVRALEVTHGDNGWHPHLHVLVFTSAALTDDQLALVHHKVFSKWEARVMKTTGKQASRKGFSFATAERGTAEMRLDAAKDYVAKFGADKELEEIVIQRRTWGAADELTRSHLKEKGRGGRSPWKLLADFNEGDMHAGMLWKEFVAAFKGRSQLQWSRGLRETLGLDQEQDDEQAAAAVEAEDILLARITVDDWKVIVDNKLRGLVLEILRVGEWKDVDIMLSRFRKINKLIILESVGVT